MDDVFDRPVGELVAAVAEQTPAPGGGCVAAWTIGLAAALVQMTAAFTLAREDASDAHADMRRLATRSALLADHVRELAEIERTAFEPVLEVLRTPADSAGRRERLDEALSHAAESPLAIARVAGEVADLARVAVEQGTTHLRGDAQVGVLLAEASCQAAAQLVRINLSRFVDDPRLAEVGELTARAAEARASVWA